MHQLFSKNDNFFREIGDKFMKFRGNALYQSGKVCQEYAKNRKKGRFCPFFAKFEILCDFIACFREKKCVFCQKKRQQRTPLGRKKEQKLLITPPSRTRLMKEKKALVPPPTPSNNAI